MSISPLQLAGDILREAETADFVFCLSAQNIPPPRTPETYLCWLEEEAERQTHLAELCPEDAPRHHTRATRLQEFADRLRDLGFVPPEESPPISPPIPISLKTPPVFAPGPMKQAVFAFYTPGG